MMLGHTKSHYNYSKQKQHTSIDLNNTQYKLLMNTNLYINTGEGGGGAYRQLGLGWMGWTDLITIMVGVLQAKVVGLQ